MGGANMKCGNDWRRRRPLAAHLPWVPAFAGTTVGVGGKDDAWGRPFDRLRANGRASSLWVFPCAGGLSALGFY